MGLIGKEDKKYLYFDRVARTQINEKLLSFIMASAWTELDNESDKKMVISDKIKYYFEMNQKKGKGSYGNDENTYKQFERQYTIGLEVGIWKNSNLDLSNVAWEVFYGKTTIRDLVSRFCLNCFEYIKDYGYLHPLYELAKYLLEQNKTEVSKSELINLYHVNSNVDINDSNYIQSIGQLYNFLNSTYFFRINENKNLEINKPFSSHLILEMCNLKYQNANKEEVKEYLLNQENYASYITKVENSMYFNLLTRVFYGMGEEEKLELDTLGNNIIYFGAPGTGKSYNIKEFIKSNGIPSYSDKENHPNVFRTTLHPEYSYHDFVGQVMPIVKEENDGSNSIQYDFVPQVFTDSVLRAYEKENEPVFLILEEMSRANVAAVFGDLFQLLDRDENGESEYRINNSLITNYINKKLENKVIEKLYIPRNLFIVGTVNTSDQNVFVMDTAFKRRFEFEYVDANKLIENESKTKYLNDYQFSILGEEYSWTTFIKALNKFIVSDSNEGLALSEDKQLGQFFLKFKLDSNGDPIPEYKKYNDNQIKNKLLQYLWNDIKGASYSEISLFDKDINSFSQAYSCFNDDKDKPNELFSKEFKRFLELELSHVSKHGGESE
ncbi:McrB family protein [Macrococcus sp. DPC7161]|uniref:McrB family protein n=1 Tax=Macrococcus sp. DPC7161 TaxID=2507060 RepID=UPI00100BE2DB|nr:AAA family ATPase [Macrococcus sp. DPC7161]RXK18337.1 hypothetical protein ER639_06500 [Macrococcus sp. DPC7161]